MAKQLTKLQKANFVRRIEKLAQDADNLAQAIYDADEKLTGPIQPLACYTAQQILRSISNLADVAARSFYED